MDAIAGKPIGVEHHPQPLRLRGYWLTLARAGWCFFALYVFVCFGLGLSPSLNLLHQPCDPGTCPPGSHWLALTPQQVVQFQQAGISLDFYAGTIFTLEVVVALIYVACALLIFYYRSDEWLALIASLTLIIVGAFLMTNPSGAAIQSYPLLAPLSTVTVIVGNWLFAALLFLIPNGTFTPRWSRWFFVLLGGFVTFIMIAFDSDTLDTPDGEVQKIGAAIFTSCILVGVFGQIYRYRQSANDQLRQQIKWIGFGLAGMTMNFVIGGLLSTAPRNVVDLSPLGLLASFTLRTIGQLFLPIALAFAVLRYRLWEIDVVIRRTLLYGIVTALIAALYFAVVGGLGALLHGQSRTGIGFVGAGIAAILFQPLRQRIQQAVNRLFYGQRDEPYVVLARLGRQLESTPVLDKLLPTIVTTIQQTLKLPYVALETNNGVATANVATHNSSWANAAQIQQIFPLLYQNQRVGQLVVSPRLGEADLSPGDRHLLEDLARQAGVAVHAVHTTAELQEARSRLVTAREEERRRLRRDLHDGLGPALAAIAAQSEAARDLIATRPEVSTSLLGEIIAQSQSATGDIRRLVYDLRPPALDDLGLVGAIQAQAQRLNQPGGLQLTVQADDDLPALSAAVEVATYRIAHEALTNVMRHARATHCALSLQRVENQLQLEVRDNGIGMDLSQELGVGMRSMRERAEELGGKFELSSQPGSGTTLYAWLPLS